MLGFVTFPALWIVILLLRFIKIILMRSPGWHTIDFFSFFIMYSNSCLVIVVSSAVSNTASQKQNKPHAQNLIGIKTQKTFLSQLLVVDQFSMSQVVQDGAKVGGVSVNYIGSCLILLQRRKQRKTRRTVH